MAAGETAANMKTGDGLIMARGVRKNPREKLEDKLTGVNEAIAQYESCIEKLATEKKQLEEELERMEIVEITAILKERQMSVSELKEMVCSLEK